MAQQHGVSPVPSIPREWRGGGRGGRHGEGKSKRQGALKCLMFVMQNSNSESGGAGENYMVGSGGGEKCLQCSEQMRQPPCSTIGVCKNNGIPSASQPPSFCRQSSWALYGEERRREVKKFHGIPHI